MRWIAITGLGFVLAACEGQCNIVVESHPNAVDAGDASIITVKLQDDVKPSVTPVHILLIGDSQTGAVWPRVDEVKKNNEVVEVEYKVGTSISHWAYGHRFGDAIAKHSKPDVVVVFLGTNDYWRTLPPDVQPILDEIERVDSRCVWVGPTMVQGQKHVINQLIKQAVSPRCLYVDTETLDIPLRDGIHPTWPGELKWLRVIWTAVEQHG